MENPSHNGLRRWKPVRLRNVVVSTQHNAGVDRSHQIEPDLIEHVIRPIVPEEFQDDAYDVHVNPSGRFVIGGQSEMPV
ncbi:MAG: hypothetical protein CM15mP49_08890 [Actinomycetota bacterium]|nr:MAG: hypothetical protein CM15mP49_08890 [Actinomycetota bacterium]